MAGNTLVSRRNLTGSDLQHCQFMQEKAETWLQQGKFKEAIEALDQALRLQRRVFGEKNRDVLVRYKAISREVLQSLKMTHSSSEPSLFVSFLLQFEKVLLQLDQSLIVPELSELYTVLAAAYRSLTNFDLSKQFLLKALKLANAHPDTGASRAAIYLGLCSSFSAAKEYTEALKYGKSAVKYAWEELQTDSSSRGDKLSLLAVGYHNIGVQEERLKHRSIAVDCYRKAVTLLEEQGSEQHMSLLADLRKSLTDAQLTHRNRPPKTNRTLPSLNKSANNSPQPSLRRRSASKTRTPEARKPTPLRAFLTIKDPISTSYVSSADRSYQTSLVSTPRAADSDEDIRELAARGLLDYTIDSDCRREDREQGRKRAVRGRKRKGVEGREILAAGSTSANTPIASGEVICLSDETEVQAPHSLPASSSVFPTLPVPVHRDFLIHIAPPETETTVLHSEEQLHSGSPDRTFSPLSVSGSHPAVQSSIYEELTGKTQHKAAVSIQKAVRGLLSRRKTPKITAKYTLKSRSGVKLDPFFLLSSLLSNGEALILRLDGAIAAELPVPACFAHLSASALSAQLHIHGTTVSFSPVLRLSPPCTPPNAPFSDTESDRLDSSTSQQEQLSMAIPNLSTADTVSLLLPSIELCREGKPTDKVAFQGLADLGRDQVYAVMGYESGDTVAIRAFPQAKGVPIPEQLVLNRETLCVQGEIDWPRLVKLIKLEETGTLRLVDGTEPPIAPFSPLRSPLFQSTNAQCVSPRSAEFVQSVTTIQSCFRVHMARLERRWRTLNPRKMIYRGCRQLSSKTLDQVAVFAEEDRVTVEARDVGTAAVRRLLLGPKDFEELDISPNDGKSLFERLYCSKDRLMITPTLLRQTTAAKTIQKLLRGVMARYRYKDLLKKSKRKLQFFAQKVVDAEVFYLAIYESPDKVQVERFKVFPQRQLKYRSQTVTFPFTEIMRLYGRVPPMPLLFEDLFLTSSSIVLRPRVRCENDSGFAGFSMVKRAKEATSALKGPEVRSIIRTSKRLADKMWVITVNLGEEGTLEFTAFAGSDREPLRVSALLKELADKTKLPETAVFPIGTITVQRLLKIDNRQLVIDFTAETPDLNKLATLMQASVRGFLVRRRLTVLPAKSSLLACQVVKLNDEPWVLYAYRQPPWIDIKGYKRYSHSFVPVEDSISDSIFRNFPPSISNKRVVENFVFPKYSLEGQGEELHFRTTKSIQGQASILDRHKEKFRVIAGSPNNLARLTQRHPTHKRVTSLNRSPIFPLATSIDIPSSPTPAKASLVRRMLSKDNISLQISPPKTARPESCGRTASFASDLSRKLVLKSGVEIAGRAYQASMFLDRSTLLIQLVDAETGEVVQRQVHADKDVEQQAELLLNRLRVKRGEAGLGQIEISEGEEEEILYRRSHYVSSRFYHVTVYRTKGGVRIEALDPTTKETLVLPLELVLESPVQRQLSRLMNRLEVISVRGVMVLSLYE